MSLHKDLKEEFKQLYKDFQKYPSLWVLVVIIIIVCTVLPYLGFTCKTCSPEAQVSLIVIGLVLAMFILAFIGLPFLVLQILNCCF